MHPGACSIPLEGRNRTPIFPWCRPIGCTKPGLAHVGGPFCMSLQGGYAMRTFDLSPLYRSTVGFDRLFSMLDQGTGFEGGGSPYPPYNIERTGENAYRVTIAVAGF